MFNDGQTVKTIAVFDALSSKGIKPSIVDTYYFHKRNIFRFGCSFIKSIIFDKKYIVLLSQNGRRVLFPFLSFISWFMKKEIYHYAIGGRLADEVASGIHSVSLVNSFCANWVESKKEKKYLSDLGVTNAKYIPNFKNIIPLSEQELVTDFHEPYRFCTFSRVMKEKGITDAVNAIKCVNEELERNAVKLDIYGPVEASYKAEFDALVTENDAVRYCGVIPANESNIVLRDCYMLLFPTHYRREGMPGTVIDAMSAGVPIIARSWVYCDEMITDGVNGYIYDFDKPELLREKILYAITNIRQTVEMRKNCLKSAQEYDAETVIGKIRKDLQV